MSKEEKKKVNGGDREKKNTGNLEEDEKKKRLDRIMTIYTKLMNGETVIKSEEVERYGMTGKSIQRDFSFIRELLIEISVEEGYVDRLVSGRNGKYWLEKKAEFALSENEVLTVCKILLGSRGLNAKEMEHIIEALLNQCIRKKNRKKIAGMIGNERLLYVEPQHGAPLAERIGELEEAIQHNRCIIIDYQKLKGKEVVTRRLCPVGLMFSEYYFYLLAYIDDEEILKKLELEDEYISPTHYRIDRIQKLEVLSENFRRESRFEEGEYRKKTQYMFGGKLRRVKFKYKGLDINAVLDKLPTAKILSVEDGVYTVTAQVMGSGVDMWLRGQGEDVEMVE